jgi:menaquinol-cytochrome c reductase iron-sulfur subunit
MKKENSDKEVPAVPCPCEKNKETSGVSRRGFLSATAAGLAALIGGFLGGSGLTYFISPAFKKEAEDWVDLGPASSFKSGVPAKVDYAERRRDAWAVSERRSSAWVLTADSKNFTVFDPKCTHLGCPFRWDQAKEQFLCPCHAGVFSKEGQVVSGPPPRPLDQYAAKVEGGRLFIQPAPRKEAA